MKFSVQGDVSQWLREMETLTSGPNSIYKIAGKQLRDALLEEFDQMVRETAQYSGTTAASYYIGFMYKLNPDVVEFPKPKSVLEALQKGSEPACSISINRARDTLPEDLRDYYMSSTGRGGGQDIVIMNEARGFDTAEDGPVRSVNTPPGALSRFEARVRLLDILVDHLK